MKKQASSIVFGRLCLLAMLAPVLASAQGSYLKLPDDYSQSAIVYVDPGEKPNMSHLTQEEIIKLGEWLKVKSEKSKEGDVMITYREKADEGVPIYQPAGFKGQAKVGAVGEEMTDGRLTLKVAGVKRTIYASMGYGGYGSSSLPYEYVAACVLGNPGTADVKVKSLTYYFFEPDGNLGAAMERRAVKQDGNVLSEQTEAEVYKAGSKQETEFSSSGTCKVLNNLCLKMSYEDGKETLFAVYVPPSAVEDKLKGDK